MKKLLPKFSQINYKGLDINILVEPKFLGYSFHYEGNNYGSKVPITTTKKQELLENSFALCIQAILSYEELCKKISITEFQKQLQEIDPRILIVPNNNRPGASNIFLNGADICPWIPSFEMQDEHTPDYVYKLNDMPIPFKTTEEALDIVKRTLEQLKQPEYSDALFDMPVDVKEEVYGQHKA